MNLTEAVLLGVIQGVFEWLPVSSEAVISIVMVQVFGSGVSESLNSAIWLHTGTMLAALIYFRTDFIELTRKALSHIERREVPQEGVLRFVVVATFVTSALGGALYFTVLEALGSNPNLFSALTGAALLFTGITRFYSGGSSRESGDVNDRDSVIAGVLQGLAVLPGVSRSGSTVLGLFYRDFSAQEAFRLSFLLSVPAVIIANIGMNLFSGFTVTSGLLIATAVSFVVGYIAIDTVLKVAERAEVAYICFVLAAISFLPLVI